MQDFDTAQHVVHKQSTLAVEDICKHVWGGDPIGGTPHDQG